MLALWGMRLHRVATRTSQLEKNVTTGLLFMLTGISLCINNGGFVVGLNGALVGSALVYVFPSLMFLKRTGRQKGPVSSMVHLERWFCRFLVGFGIAAAISGAGAVVANTFLLVSKVP